MAPDAFFYPLLLAALVVVCLIIHVWWPNPRRAGALAPSIPSRARATQQPN